MSDWPAVSDQQVAIQKPRLAYLTTKPAQRPTLAGNAQFWAPRHVAALLLTDLDSRAEPREAIRPDARLAWDVPISWETESAKIKSAMRMRD